MYQVTDASLETNAASSRVRDILADFSSRHLNITESWENWTSIIEENRKTERLIEEIMSKNELVSASYK